LYRQLLRTDLPLLRLLVAHLGDVLQHLAPLQLQNHHAKRECHACQTQHKILLQLSRATCFKSGSIICSVSVVLWHACDAAMAAGKRITRAEGLVTIGLEEVSTLHVWRWSGHA